MAKSSSLRFLLFSLLWKIALLQSTNIKFYLNSRLQCNNTWPFDGAVVYSDRKPTGYTNNHHCLVNFTAASPSERVLVQVIRYNIPDCNDSLTFFDGSQTTGRPIATLNCQQPTVSSFETNSSTLGLLFETDGSGNSGGFEIVLTGIFNNGCQRSKDRWFRCSQGYCIHRSLICDHVPHCLGGEDKVDEDVCSSDDDDDDGVAAAAVLASVGTLLLAGLMAAALCMARRDKKKILICWKNASATEKKEAPENPTKESA